LKALEDENRRLKRMVADQAADGRPFRLWAVVDSFNGKFRDECLNLHHFADIPHAQRITSAWHADYHTERPHHSLGQRTPAEFAALFTPEEPYSSLLTLRS
jgi:putative transposase